MISEGEKKSETVPVGKNQVAGFYAPDWVSLLTITKKLAPYELLLKLMGLFAE